MRVLTVTYLQPTPGMPSGEPTTERFERVTGYNFDKDDGTLTINRKLRWWDSSKDGYVEELETVTFPTDRVIRTAWRDTADDRNS